MQSDKNILVLVVDDDDDLREALVANLEYEGFSVLAAASGNEALKVLLANPKINFVLSDIRMNDGDGIELLTQIRKIDPKIPVVCLISGYSGVSKAKIIEMGAIDLISKPPDIKLIFKYVRESVAS